VVAIFTQGVGQSQSKAVAIGLDYVGLSARKLKIEMINIE